MPVRYYLYDNWTKRRARVHREGCSFINHTRAKYGIAGTQDMWVYLGECYSIPRAMAAAFQRAHGRYADFAHCEFCRDGWRPLR